MKKLAIIDIDGVIADCAERISRARIAMETLPIDEAISVERYERERKRIYWQTFLRPDLLHLDVPVKGAYEALETLLEAEYQCVYVSSRPEQLRQETVAWLKKHGFSSTAIPLILKPSPFEYTKTALWKAGMVQTLAPLYSAEKVLFIDDKEENTKNASSIGSASLWCYNSLQEAAIYQGGKDGF